MGQFSMEITRPNGSLLGGNQPAWVLAERYGTTEQTIWKWRKRDTVQDRSHTPHRLQTTLTPAQEAVAVVLRRSLLLSLDDLLAVVREFLNPQVSRSGLDRCLRRHGAGNLQELVEKTPHPVHKPFKHKAGIAWDPPSHLFQYSNCPTRGHFRLRTHIQNMTAAARAIADRNRSAQRS